MDGTGDEVFESAGCSGWALLRDLADGREVALRADEPVVLASTMKVLVALEVEQAFAEGRLDPATAVRVGDEQRVPGPVGLSLFTQDAVVSLQDLVVLMLTVSDNTATDLLIDAVGLATINQRAHDLGMPSTVIEAGLGPTLDSIAADLGHPGWSALTEVVPDLPEDEAAALDQALPEVRALTPATATRSTPRDMVTLLEKLCAGTAAATAACEQVRFRMGQQVTRHRLAAGFPPGVSVAAKSGGLLGIARNEIGIITYPDGATYAAAVFTRTPPGSDARPVDAAIGTWARHAVDELRSVR